MQKTPTYFLFLWIFLPILGLLGITMLPESVAMGLQVPTPTQAMPPKAEKSWIISNLPPDASQLQRGAEIYRLVCKACHGDKGQGLTDEWRSTWAPEDQNCWKSKCHASNHPPDGFSMPAVPSVVGTIAMSRFATALDLHAFISQYMPWQDPGSLNTAEAWQVTAFILKLNDIDPGSEINAATATKIRLRATQPITPSDPSSTSEVDIRQILLWSVPALILLILVVRLTWYQKAK
jgi:cytochrome c5